MSVVLPFPVRHAELTDSERAAGLIVWQQALEDTPMRADLCVNCSAPTELHFGGDGRYRGCAHALRRSRGQAR